MKLYTRWFVFSIAALAVLVGFAGGLTLGIHLVNQAHAPWTTCMDVPAPNQGSALVCMKFVGDGVQPEDYR